MDPQIRRELRRQENEARRSAPVIGPATIGPRSNTGTYDVNFADGSLLKGKGIKVFNTAHSEGDTVVAIPRQDGYIALEGSKARPIVPSILDDPCGNYLAGQIFSCPQPEELKGKVYVLFESQGKTWIGGHRTTPELVGDSTTTSINTPKLWADSQGWVVLGFESASTTSNRLEITRGGVIRGPRSPIYPEEGWGNMFYGDEFSRERHLGFNVILDAYGPIYSNGSWTVPTNQITQPDPLLPNSYSEFGPTAFIGSPIFRNRFIKYTEGPAPNPFARSFFTEINNFIGIRQDRSSALVYRDYSKTHQSNDGSYVTEDPTGTLDMIRIQPGLPDQIFNQYGSGNYQASWIPVVPQLPNGMYTNGVLTTVKEGTAESDINSLKTQSGIVRVTTQAIGGVVVEKQVRAYKIPSDATVLKYVCTTS